MSEVKNILNLCCSFSVRKENSHFDEKKFTFCGKPLGLRSAKEIVCDKTVSINTVYGDVNNIPKEITFEEGIYKALLFSKKFNILW